MSRAFESWDKDIAETYATLRRSATPAELKPVEAGQLSWAAYKDHEFAFLDAMLMRKRGTLYVPMRIEYRIEILKARALELERYVERVKALKGDQ